jgi:hypothetical protein
LNYVIDVCMFKYINVNAISMEININKEPLCLQAMYV